MARHLDSESVDFLQFSFRCCPWSCLSYRNNIYPAGPRRRSCAAQDLPQPAQVLYLGQGVHERLPSISCLQSASLFEFACW